MPTKNSMIKKVYRARIAWALAFFLLVAVGMASRLVYMQAYKHQYWTKRAARQHERIIKIKPSRGFIYSRNGRVLASSSLMDSAYVDTPRLKNHDTPKLEQDPIPQLVKGFSKILNIKQEKIERKLSLKGHVPIARKITAEQSILINKLRQDMGISIFTVYFVKESKRQYPLGQLASHILGFTTYDDYGDNKGLDGLELKFDDQIKGTVKEQKATHIQGAGSKNPYADETIAASFGHDLILTLDEGIQEVAEKSLAHAVNKFRAVGGCIVVQRVKTGEILALANMPTYDPNNRTKSQAFTRRNRCLTDVIEPGSVMKTFFAAMLFDLKKADPSTIIDCQNGKPLRIGRQRIRDTHPLGIVPYRMAFQESSNIGCVKIAQIMSARQMRKYLIGFGFGQKTGIQLPGEESSYIKALSKWKINTQHSMPMGYELNATALQIADALNTIANNGVRMKPYIIKEIRSASGETIEKFEPQEIERVVSTLASKQLRGMMENVVAEGTGTNAQIPGYRVGGKTGTAMKVVDGVYAKRYIASFAGIVPIQNPEISIYVYIDDPQGAKYGGTVAAPVFKTVATHALKVLKIEPSEEVLQDIQIVQEKLNKQHNSEDDTIVERPLIIANGNMPNLKNLTMREAAIRLKNLQVTPRFHGTGIAQSQTPKPNALLKPNQICEVTFE